MTKKRDDESQDLQWPANFTPSHSTTNKVEMQRGGELEDQEESAEESVSKVEPLLPGMLMPDGTTDANAYFRNHSRLVLAAVGRSHHYRVVKSGRGDPALEDGDLIQEAWLGFIRGVQKFDPKRGAKFSTYVWPWLNQKIDNVMGCSGRIHIPIDMKRRMWKFQNVIDKLCKELGHYPSPEELAFAFEVTLSEIKGLMAALTVYKGTFLDINGSRDTTRGEGRQLVEMLVVPTVGPDPDIEASGSANLMALLEKAPLTPRERTVIHQYFVLEWTLEQVGGALGLTRERARQIKVGALNKLRAHLARESNKGARSKETGVPDTNAREVRSSTGKNKEIPVRVRKVRPPPPPSPPPPVESPVLIQENERIDPDLVLEAVMEYYGADRAELLSPLMDQLNVLPRQVLVYLLYTYTTQTLHQTSVYVGMGDNAAFRVKMWIEDEVEKDGEVQDDINELRLLLGAKRLRQLAQTATIGALSEYGK